MADGPPDDVEDLDDVEEGPADEGRVLAPEELDITESEHVEELDEGRFVVSPDGPPNVRSERGEGASPSEPREDDPDEGARPQRQNERSSSPRRSRSRRDRQPPRQDGQARPELTQEQVHRWLRESFEDSSSQYGFDVTATFEGAVSQRRMASNDVVTIFESLMLWYAQQVDGDTPVEEILGILLMESNVPVRYPPESIHRLVKSANLTPEDTIADLLAEVENGVQF